MHVLISSARDSAALRTHSGSARKGRASETRSAPPSASTPSATSGMLIRLVATTGTDTCSLSRAAYEVNAARGTEVTIVGTRASCQPMPRLRMLAPAASTSRASAVTSSHVWPSSTRSSTEMR